MQAERAAPAPDRHLRPMRLAVFASGSGTNFQSIIDARERGDLPCEISLCLSDRPTAGALVRAEKHGIATTVLVPAAFSSGDEYAAALLQELARRDVNFVALAGYLKMIPAGVVRPFEGRMVNVHPALLPAFGGKGMYGRRVHQAVLEYGAHWSGATVHLVDERYDNGPVVLQEPVPVLPDDTVDTLARRVLDVEHRIYPEALRLFAENRVKVEGRRVRVLDF